MRLAPIALALVLVGLLHPAAAQTADDPAVRAAVERYYKALEAEDIDAYLALWSTAARRPQRESLKYLFESADERFSEIEILRAVSVGDRLRVRVSARRERTGRPRVPGGPPFVMSSVNQSALTLVTEGGEWKVVSEGSPADDLAAAVVAAGTAEERDALLAAEPDLVNTLLVAAVARIASQAAVMMQYARAQSLYERVIELAKRTGSRREEGDGLQNLGNALYFQRKMPDALRAYEQRLALEQQRGDDAAVASALVGMATVRYSIAEYSEALKNYQLAAAIQERLDDRPSTAGTLLGIGNIRYLQADFAGAIRDYSRSRELYRGFSDPDGDARALEGLGRTYSAQGDYASALTAFAGVLAEGRARSDRSRQATATQSIADVHLRLGNIDAARRHYDESRDHFMAQKDPGGAGRVWQGLGMTELIAGRFDAGEQAYKTSATLCGGIADGECTAHAIVGLAFAQAAQEKYLEAIPAYRKAIDAFAALGGREAAARAEVGLSQALAGTGQFTAAIDASTRARHTGMALDNDDVIWRALTAEARALRKSGDLGKALAVARAAAGVVDEMHRAALAKPATAIASDATAAFATLAILQAETGDPGAAWTSASQMRTIELRTAVAVNEREIARGMTPEEREEERRAASELLSLLAQAERERRLPKPDTARLKALEERISAAAAARTAWMDALFSRVPEIRLWRGRDTPPSADQVLAVLAPGTAILEWVVDDDDVLVIVATATPEPHVSAYPAPIRRRVLAERVNALLQSQTLRDPRQWRKVASEIAELIPRDARARLADASRIIIVPHDVTWRIPFEALPFGDGYLGDAVLVAYAGSRASVAGAARLDAAQVKSMVAVGAPELLPATMDRLQQTAPGWPVRDIAAAKQETTAVADVYGGEVTVLSGAAATEAAFRERASTASALHFAAPFRINGASPLFSPVLLSGDRSKQIEADDGALDAREVMNLSLRARVAVLTDGAATSMRDGASAADVVQWAWLAAGVPSVLLARWAADPPASEALLAEFHRRLRGGADPAAALDAARRAVRARPGWAAPFYWAGWMGLGR